MFCITDNSTAGKSAYVKGAKFQNGTAYMRSFAREAGRKPQKIEA